MNREQLAHIVRAASRVVGDGNIVIIGSQAVLATWDDEDLPEAATRSIEADIAFFEDPDERKADEVDGVIGELSSFHGTHGYYGQGVTVSTAVLPTGWETRLVELDRPDALPGRARCLEVHDLVIAKLVAGREKDIEFTRSLFAVGYVDAETLVARASTVDRPRAVIDRVLDSIEHCRRTC